MTRDELLNLLHTENLLKFSEADMSLYAENERLTKELVAARAYIKYTAESYHHDTEQDELWRNWHDARATPPST
jgi:hypothetical protein